MRKLTGQFLIMRNQGVLTFIDGAPRNLCMRRTSWNEMCLEMRCIWPGGPLIKILLMTCSAATELQAPLICFDRILVQKNVLPLSHFLQYRIKNVTKVRIFAFSSRNELLDQETKFGHIFNGIVRGQIGTRFRKDLPNKLLLRSSLMYNLKKNQPRQNISKQKLDNGIKISITV